MNHLIYMYIVISGVLASPYAPIQTPITTVAAVHVRQDITSAATTTPPELIVYYSAADSDEMTIWAPVTYSSVYYAVTSSDDFYNVCYMLYYYTIGTTLSTSTSTYCPLWTTASLGYMIAASSSYFCMVNNDNTIYSNFLYSTWAAENPLTQLFCGLKTDSTVYTITAYYLTKPPTIVPTTDLKTAPTTNSPASTPQVPPTSSSSSSQNPAPAKPNNVPVIAGSVAGGVGAICIAAVAIVIIRRRGKNRTSQMIAPPVVEGSPIGQLEKYEGPPLPTRGMGVPEYNPHTSISSTDGSPPTHSPVPPYELGHGQRPHRNELLG